MKITEVAVRDHHPLKQGLRPESVSTTSSKSSQRPSSTKTRIKTKLFLELQFDNQLSQRPSSTKTRIKTNLF